MEDYNMDELRQALQKIEAKQQAASQTTNLAEKQQKVARLIVLLTQIERELTTIKQTLLKLEEHTVKHNPTSPLLPQIKDRQATVERLTLKIQSTRLNLNYYFI